MTFCDKLLPMITAGIGGSLGYTTLAPAGYDLILIYAFSILVTLILVSISYLFHRKQNK